MTGLPSGVTVEIEFTASVWTDVTAYVAAENKVSARFGRSTEFDDVNAATCTLVLRNDDGRFTPDSAGSPYYPDVIEGRRIRVTVTKSSVDYPLFTGSILSWEPSYSAGALNTGTVTVTANDSLALLALHTFDSRWVEETRALARDAATWADIYILKGDATTAAWDNVGLSTGGDLGTATLVPATPAVGEVSYGTPSSLTLDGSVEFKPVSNGVVADIIPAAAPQVVSFWLQVAVGNVEGGRRVITLRNGGGEYGSVRISGGGPERLDVNDTAASVSPLATLVADVADAAWRLITLTAAGGSTVISATDIDGTVSSYTAAFDLTAATSIVLGGEIADGTQSHCPSVTAASLCIAGDTTVAPSYLRALPGQTYSHTDLFTTYQSYVPELADWAATGGEVRTVGEPTWKGQTALAVLQTIARTISGVAYVDGSGNVTLAAADVVRPGVSAATLDIEEDLDAASAMPQFRRAADSRPTRVAITYAGGTTTLVDTDAEANNQPRREVKLDTCASDVTGAEFAGAYLLQAANGLRITQVAVDLTTSLADLWATFLGLYPTAKVTISGFDAALIGAATKVVFVQGWKVDIDHQSVVYTLDCSPGSEFATASWDAGDEYGRWSAGTSMTVTSGTAIGTASNGTLVITTTGTTVTLTKDPAMYPLYLDWDDEIVQVTDLPLHYWVNDAFGSQDNVNLTGWGSDVLLSSGRVRINATASYPALSTVASDDDLTGGGAAVQAVQVPNIGNGSTQAFLSVDKDANNTLQIVWENDVLYFKQRVAGVFTSLASVAYNATTHAWWRITESGGTTTWATSSNGSSWTTRATASNPVPVTAVSVNLYAAFYDTEPAPGFALYDNLTAWGVSSTSPQVVTTTGRGQLGTAARTNHVANESIDLMKAAVFGF